MPIDPSIPLQVHQLKVPTPLESMSLKDLSIKSQINEQNLQEKQMEVRKRNSLLQLTQSPGFADPSTGMPTPQGIAAYTQVDPAGGIQLGHLAQQLNLQNMAIDEKRVAIKRNILIGYVEGYDKYLNQYGGDKAKAEQQARADTQAAIEEGRRSGHYAAQGFSSDELRHELPPVDQARLAVHAMGGKIEPAKGSTPLGNLNADYNAGNISKQDYENQKAKMLAPTFQQLVASAKPSDKQVDYWAEVVRLGGAIPQGLARSAIGSNLVTEVIKRVPEGETAPKGMLMNQAEFGGIKQGEKTLGTRQAQIELAANVTQQFAPIAIAASEKFDRSGIKSMNDLQKAVQSRSASPELRQFNFANLSLINAYARAINPQGVGNESDKAHAREVLDTGFSKGDYAAAVKQLQVEIQAELKAPGAVKGGMRGFYTGKEGETAKSAPTKTAPQAAIDYLKAHPDTSEKFKAKYGYLP